MSNWLPPMPMWTSVAQDGSPSCEVTRRRQRRYSLRPSRPDRFDGYLVNLISPEHRDGRNWPTRPCPWRAGFRTRRKFGVSYRGTLSRRTVR